MGRILVIEDDPSNQLLYQSRLRDIGHEVVVSDTGAQGITEARSSAFDLFLVDMHLGDGVDGIEVCRRLKRDPATRNVPVVLISTKIRNRADLHSGYEAGCEAFLVKNDSTLVEDVVRAMLRIKALQDELASQMGLLQQHNERLQQALQDKAELEDQLKRKPSPSGGRAEKTLLPDGVMLVDSEGTVVSADRGAQELFAKRVEGKSLGSLAPGTRLEAFVRDAALAPHEGFHFTAAPRGGRIPQELVACAFPLVPKNVGADTALRVVLLYDAARQSILWETVAATARGTTLPEVGALEEVARREFRPRRILGESPAMSAVRARVADLAESSSPVLIAGEAGTGKVHVARTLHYSGTRTGGFLRVGCADLSRTALERAVLGTDTTPGLLQRANGGTLLLEDVEKLAPALRARMVEVLRDGIKPPRAKKTHPLDVRLIGTTTRPLGSTDLQEAFGELCGSNTLELPPLRQRPVDLPVLARSILARLGSERLDLPEDVWATFEAYDWPGNVQELESVIETALAAAGDTEAIDARHLPPPLPDVHERVTARGHFTPSQRPADAVRGTHQPAASSGVPEGIREVLHEVVAALPEGTDEEIPVSFDFFEKWALSFALKQSKGDKLKAAKLLHVGKSTLYRKLNKYEI